MYFRNKLKKLSFIFITLVSLSITLGSYGIFKLFIKQYHSSVRKKIENKEFVITDTIYINPCQLYINSNTVQWVDKNKEIIYNGDLYDIVSIKNENGKVKLYVISDKQEMEYKYCFAHQEDTNNNKNSPIKLLKQFFVLKFVSTTELQFLFKKNIKTTLELPTELSFFDIHKGYQIPQFHPPINFTA